MKFPRLRFASVRDLHREREKAEHQEADHGGGFHNGVARTGDRDEVAFCVGAGCVITRLVDGGAFTLGADVGFDVLVGGARSFVARRVGAGCVVTCRVGGAGGARGAGVRGDVLVGSTQGGVTSGRRATAGADATGRKGGASGTRAACTLGRNISSLCRDVVVCNTSRTASGC